MNEILEPAEIDALMHEMRGSDAPAPQAADGRDRYDFATQDYAVQRLIPALSLVQTQFSEALKQRLRQLSPDIQGVRAERIAVMKFGELQRMLTPPCDISVILATPLGAPIYLVFEADLVFALVDQFFGGRGGAGLKRLQSDFSPSEARFMQQLGRALLPDLGQAWHSVVEIVPELLERHSDLRFVDHLKQSDNLLAARFAVTMPGHDCGVWMLVPWAAIDPVREHLGGQGRASRQEHDEQWRERLLQGIEATSIDVVARLNECAMPLSRVSRLAVGDVLPIDSPQGVTLLIEELALMTGTFGTHQGQLAVKVNHQINPILRRA
ncbi:MAG: FliM/FliN family flagellar motor switch protein [Pseudomonadota bacterium]